MNPLLLLAALPVAAVSAFLLAESACEALSDFARAYRLKEKVIRPDDELTGTGALGGIGSKVRRAVFVISRMLPEKSPLRPLLARLAGSSKGNGREINQELPRALNNISAALSVGQSNRQAFAYAAQSAKGPLSYLLYQVVWDLEAGIGLREALRSLSRASDTPEMEFVCAAFMLQQRSGGSMGAVLGHAVSSLRAANEFERSMRVQTSQARLSAKVVGVVPFVLLALMGLVSPGYITGFFSSPLGWGMFLLAIALDLAGLAAIRRIVNIRS